MDVMLFGLWYKKRRVCIDEERDHESFYCLEVRIACVREIF
jgi:hypothetical protein